MVSIEQGESVEESIVIVDIEEKLWFRAPNVIGDMELDRDRLGSIVCKVER